MKTITINIDNDNKPIVEGKESVKDSLFESQYVRCFGAIESVLYAQRYEQDNNADVSKDLEHSNNIIVFDGERGTGKTSCMLSVASMLKSGGGADGNSLLSQTKFVKLPMLEPAFFDSGHNVLSLVVSRLYAEFRHATKVSSYGDERKILELFVTVQRELKCMFSKVDDIDALEYLANLSAAVSLRADLQTLIGEYLKYVGKENSKLLILIDDIDLNQQQAYTMIEEIRKYLILDNCIVLISVKIDQLKGILFREFLKEYHNPEEDDRSEVRDRVDRYLSKLFPQSQRILMPEPEDYFDYFLKIESQRQFDYDISCKVLREAIPELVFAKTRYLFYNTAKTTSYIVPRNLRNIRQLVKLLMEMHNYSDTGGLGETNKKIFKHYFYTDWVEQNITTSHKDFVQSLTRRYDYSEVNESVLTYLIGLDSNVRHEILSDSNTNAPDNSMPINFYNISFGDVFSAIRIVELSHHELDVKKLLFFIMSYYGIVLYESYDTITRNISDKKSEDSIEFPVLSYEKSKVRNNYQALLAGSLYNPSREDFSMPHAMAEKKISKNALLNLIAKINAFKTTDERILIVKMVEFVLLYVARQNTTGTNTNYRRYPKLVYDEIDAGSDSDYLCHLGAFFYNLTCYKHAVERFKGLEGFEPFYAFINENGMPLFEDLKSFASDIRTKKYKDNDAKWLSVCCFRNMEVIEDFYEKTKKVDFSSAESQSEMLIMFLDKACEYSINTYDRYEEGDKLIPYTIGFKYLEKFRDLLSLQYVSDELETMFNYNDKSQTTSGAAPTNTETTMPESPVEPTA